MKNSGQGRTLFSPIGQLLAVAASIAGIVLAISFSGCGNRADENEILIGEFSSLTGTAATFGTSTHKGMELVVEETNAAGGVLGKKIKLLTEDTQSKPEEAATVVTKLITRDKVKAIVGEVASSRSLAAAPICQSNGVPMVTPSSTNPKVTQVGDYIFRVCFLDDFQGAVIAKFVANTLKMKRVAILKDIKNEYSVGLAEYFTGNFTKLGGEVIAVQAYSEGDNDFKAQLTALKAANPELVFVPGYYTEAALIVKQARDLNMATPFMGGDGWDSAKLLEIGGTAMEGTFYCNHYTTEDPREVVQNFVSKFRAKYNETPDAIACLAYDAGRILIEAMRRAGTTDGPRLRDAMAASKDFNGVTGIITINSGRNATKSAVIIEIKNGKLTLKETIRPEEVAM
ncbi:MAG TPA: ABC transporter substrate-binding protein [Bacteroidota bacterium]|jgi:branched-chain amino acid transport system substrate-binding protein|nr:ABC transporter substrate-binding protein [Bacteroidota bacterium]